MKLKATGTSRMRHPGAVVTIAASRSLSACTGDCLIVRRGSLLMGMYRTFHPLHELRLWV